MDHQGSVDGIRVFDAGQNISITKKHRPSLAACQILNWQSRPTLKEDFPFHNNPTVCPRWTKSIFDTFIKSHIVVVPAQILIFYLDIFYL
jgi:hypothetical protein